MTPRDKQKLKKAYDKWRHDNHLYGQSADDSIADYWLSKLEEAVNKKVEEVREEINQITSPVGVPIFYQKVFSHLNDGLLSLPSLQIKPKGE